MIERYWDGIAAYSRPENKVSVGFVEGLNNKIRVIQGRAYGLRDEEYLWLKIQTCMHKEISKSSPQLSDSSLSEISVCHYAAFSTSGAPP